MLESVHCPKCAAHYALRPPRVLQRHRRAKCFTCDHIFPIGEEVKRLFSSDELGAATVGLDASALAVHTVSTTGITEHDLRSAQLPEMRSRPQEVPEATATAEGPLDLSFATSTFSGGSLPDLPHLSLSDLEAPDSAMEKTLILSPGAHPEHRVPGGFKGDIHTHGDDELEALGLGPAPDHRAPPAPQPAPPSAEDSAPSYSSARDAIEKLMAGTPSVQRARPASMSRGGSHMDVEGTLDALEATLGGTPSHSPAFPPIPPQEDNSTVVLSPMELDQAMTAQTSETEPSASTRMLHIEDLPLADISHMEHTLRMPLPALTPPPPVSPTGSMTTPIAMGGSQPAMETVKDPNLLKVQLEGETLSNVNMDQLITMVEQGRVKEFHMVARQFSENWLEATKVPALRPVFERMRRITQIGPAPSMPSETAPVKKSLFGGLFGGKS